MGEGGVNVDGVELGVGVTRPWMWWGLLVCGCCWRAGGTREAPTGVNCSLGQGSARRRCAALTCKDLTLCVQFLVLLYGDNQQG
jgi:hypothetical protein